MKKIQFSLFALLMFQFACDPGEDPMAPMDHQQISEEFNEMFRGAFDMAESIQMVSVVDQTKDQLKVRIEVEKISDAARSHFTPYFSNAGQLQRSFYPAPPLSTKFSGTSRIQTLKNVIDTSRIFNNAQKRYIKQLTSGIAQATDYAVGFELVSSFRNQVTRSDELREDDKLLLLELASASNAWLKFVETEGTSSVHRHLSGTIGVSNPTGRITECSVNWRGAWMDGVVGLIVGATSAGIAGAVVGTFTVPIIGTVAGGVNAAVIGGAIGFTSGVLQSITSDLLTSCFRGGTSTFQQNFTSCEAAWEAYLNYQTNSIPSDCFLVDIPL